MLRMMAARSRVRLLKIANLKKRKNARAQRARAPALAARRSAPPKSENLSALKRRKIAIFVTERRCAASWLGRSIAARARGSHERS